MSILHGEKQHANLKRNEGAGEEQHYHYLL